MVISLKPTVDCIKVFLEFKVQRGAVELQYHVCRIIKTAVCLFLFFFTKGNEDNEEEGAGSLKVRWRQKLHFFRQHQSEMDYVGGVWTLRPGGAAERGWYQIERAARPRELEQRSRN